MKKYISIDRDTIARNRENGANDPAIYIEIHGVSPTISAYEVYLPDPSFVVYDPTNAEDDDPDAKAWVETYGEVWYAPTPETNRLNGRIAFNGRVSTV